MEEIKYNSKLRTHNKIKKVFSELLAEKKDLAKISAAEVAKKSAITRGTFYAHYKNIFEVAKELENDLILELDISDDKALSTNDFADYLHQVFEFLAENEEICQIFLTSDAPMLFISGINEQIRKNIRRILAEYSSENPILDLDIAFFTDGATYMILRYFRRESSLSLDEIEWYLKQHFSKMFLG